MGIHRYIQIINSIGAMKSLAKVIFQDVEGLDDSFEDDLMVEEMTQEAAITGMATWDESQYGAWVMYGVASIINALYWMQHYYYKFLFYKNSEGEYAAYPSVNTYSIWGLAEMINVVTLLAQWIPTALVWMLTTTDIEPLMWFFVMWCGVMHYVDAARFIIVGVMKVISYWTDSPTSYNSYSGFAQTYAVSIYHPLQYWDFSMEWLGFMVSFGFYMDLHSTIEGYGAEDDTEEVVAEELDEIEGDENADEF